MAITKTRTLERMEIVWMPDMEGNNYAVIHARYEDVWDDPNDNDLPISKPYQTSYRKLQPDGTETDISGEDQIIQDIAAVVWA